jgi:hypothetical protein
MDRTDKKILGVFGEHHCGKTTLVKKLCAEIWRTRSQPTLALDPYSSLVALHVWSTSIEEDFKAAVWKKKNHLVVIEDASSTIQRDREFAPFFTCITHNFHDVIVVGHDATDLLPTMRRNFDELFLFNQTSDSVKHWTAAQPSMKGLELSVGLGRFEFVHCIKFAKENPIRQKLKL